METIDFRPRNKNVPSILEYYNKFKGGVDRRNGFCAKMRRRGDGEHKWYRSVFWRLVESAVINSFMLYKFVHPEKYK